MGWITDRLKHLTDPHTHTTASGRPPADALQASAAQKWQHLLHGFQHDVDEYVTHGGIADFKQSGNFACRVSNASAKTAVIVSADLEAQTVHYSYLPESSITAVPEDGVLTLRTSSGFTEIYSADQRLSAEDARKLILQPLMFPDSPTELRPTGT